MTVSTKQEKAAYMKNWRAENKDRVKEYQKKWVSENKEHVTQYGKKYMEGYYGLDSSEFSRWMRNLRKSYSMTPENFNDLWKSRMANAGFVQ